MTTPSSTSLPRRSSRLSKGISHIPKKPGSQLSNPYAPQTLYLRVNYKFLVPLPTATIDQPNPQPFHPLPGKSGNLNVIIANLPDLRPFAGDTVDWLIQVARLIFEPLGMSSLYTFTAESLESWLEKEKDPWLWRRVEHGE